MILEKNNQYNYIGLADLVSLNYDDTNIPHF